MMRIVWGLLDNQTGTLMALFEAENLLVDYRDQLLRKWYDEVTKPVEDRDYLPGDELQKSFDDAHREAREDWLDLGYERWRADEINSRDRRFIAQRYELWNSVPPNPERLIIHYDT